MYFEWYNAWITEARHCRFVLFLIIDAWGETLWPANKKWRKNLVFSKIPRCMDFPPTHTPTHHTDGKWACLITLQLYEWCRHLRDKEYIIAAGGISAAWCLIGCCWRLWYGEVSSILEEMLIKHYQDNTTGRASAVHTVLPLLRCFYAVGDCQIEQVVHDGIQFRSDFITVKVSGNPHNYAK